MAITTYNRTDFTTSSGEINSLTLKREMNAAGISVVCTGVGPFDTGCSVETDGDPTAGDLTLMAAVVAAHTGEWFAAELQKVASESEDPDDTGDEVLKVSLSTGILQKGTYLITYSMEVCLTSDGGTTTGARALFKVNTNGGGYVERGQHNNSKAFWQKFAEPYMIDCEDGDSFVFGLLFARIGTSGNAARARFARIGIRKIG